jgi:PTS system galactitol-specific IIB component
MYVKRILLACGSGVATSEAVRVRIEKLLNSEGFEGGYTIDMCKIAQAPELSSSYDFLIATTQAPVTIKCPYVNGVPFLMSVGVDEATRRVLQLMRA